MPYEGLPFKFVIQAGGHWRHEFPPAIIRSTGLTRTDWTGWAATMEIRKRPPVGAGEGLLIATLAVSGTRDGDITLGADGIPVADLSAAFTTNLEPTHVPGRGKVRALVHATLTFTDPDHPTEPYVAAIGRGAIKAI